MKTRQTAQQAELINAHVTLPPNGSKVLALTRMGVLVACEWNSRTIQWADAWCKYPSVPDDVREIQASRYKVD